MPLQVEAAKMYEYILIYKMYIHFLSIFYCNVFCFNFKNLAEAFVSLSCLIGWFGFMTTFTCIVRGLHKKVELILLYLI